MVGGTTFRRTVIHGEIPGSWSFNFSGKPTGASHRTGKLCAWQRLRSYRGAPAL